MIVVSNIMFQMSANSFRAIVMCGRQIFSVKNGGKNKMAFKKPVKMDINLHLMGKFKEMLLHTILRSVNASVLIKVMQ